jgi:hypothetical protein
MTIFALLIHTINILESWNVSMEAYYQHIVLFSYVIQAGYSSEFTR